MSQISGQRILITGASSGIGETTAKALVDRGHSVFGTSRKPTVQTEGGPRWLQMDVCDDHSVAAGVASMADQAGGIDAVICNAGMSIFGAVEDVSIEDAQRQFETNFFGVLRVLRCVLPHMRQQASGRILLVGSLAGRAPIPFQAHYSASKAAVDALSAALTNEVNPFGIPVVLIEPGDIKTPFNEAMEWTTHPSETVYARTAQQVEKVVRESLPVAPPPEAVARVIIRALESRRPRSRYTVGAESRLVPFAKRFLPDRVNLALIRRHFGL